MTVHELLHGETAPLSGPEFNYWLAHFKLRAEEEEEANKKSNKKGSKHRTDDNPRTMGST